MQALAKMEPLTPVVVQVVGDIVLLGHLVALA